MKAIINAKIITPTGVVENGAVLFDEHIRWVGTVRDCDQTKFNNIIDAQGLYVGPGLVDMHIHGVGGVDVMDATPDALLTMSTVLPQYGVTSFLPTIISAPWSSMSRALENIRAAQTVNLSGARVLGAHLEGPFLNPAWAGAHAKSALQLPDFSILQEFLDVLRVVTLAPELAGGGQFIHSASKHQELVLAIGHSNVSFEQAQEAIERGIRHAVHIFNAMHPLHHREPGLVGAILAHQLSAELIADDIHVHPGLYKVLLQSLGVEKLILVSDAMRGTGLGEGRFELGGQEVTVANGAARLASGQLAGSILTLDQAVRNFRRSTDIGLPEVIALASQNPARLLGLSQKGSLQKGKDADIIVFDDDIRIAATFLGGNLVHGNLPVQRGDV